jgi:predicted ABC-type transport system involved in lysophospholipase L1 biosynthesis ATPase subunit
MAEAFAVDIEGVRKNFGALRALDGVNLHIKTGEIYGFLGPNGAGKTTLIRSIVGLVAPDAGTVTVLGRRMPDVDNLRNVGYMTQQAALYPGLSVEENVQFFAAINGADEQGVTDALQLVRLDDRRKSVVATLSGGLRQRCSLPSCGSNSGMTFAGWRPTAQRSSFPATSWMRRSAASASVCFSTEKCLRKAAPTRFARWRARTTWKKRS